MTREQKVSGRDLIAEGWQPGPVMGAALEVAETLERDAISPPEILSKLNRVRQSPQEFEDDPLYGTLAARLIKLETPPPVQPVIRDAPVPYQLWGKEFEPGR